MHLFKYFALMHDVYNNDIPFDVSIIAMPGQNTHEKWDKQLKYAKSVLAG